MPLTARNVPIQILGHLGDPVPSQMILDETAAGGDEGFTSRAVIEQSTRDTNRLISGVRDIAASYVRTLAAWRSRFMAQTEAVRAMGFDDRFIRMWEYYLALSEAGFATGISQDLQLVLEKRRGLAV